jgi:hypothetical protein
MKTLPGLWVSAFFLIAVLSAPDARAAAVWPTDPWVQLQVGASLYWDPLGDENPEATDLIGGFDDGIEYSAAAFQISDVVDDNQLSLRMRLDADGSGTNAVWQWLFDTDADSDVDWILEVRQSGNPGGQQVVFAEALPGGPSFDDVTMSATAAWTGTLTDWSWWSGVDDGSTFDDDPDFFLDAAIPLDAFYSITSLSAGDSFSIAASTSTSHSQVNKDTPLGLDGTDPVDSGFSDPLQTVPEPGTAALSGMGLAWLAALRARARRRTPRTRA